MENYYEILEIRKNATNGEIKNSYIKLLRVYPPEKNQEKFSKIREAYEVLSNEKTKKEYDIFLEYGDDIKKLEEKADEAFEKEDFKKAIINLKKILLFNRDLSYIKNRLGLALSYNGDNDKAIDIFLELLESDNDNPIFNYNLAIEYIKKEEYIKAEKYLLKANDLDPINDAIISTLIGLYIDRKKYKKAIMFLKSCIGKYGDDNFRDFIYYIKMIEVYILSNDIDKMSDVVSELVKITPDDRDIKNHVSLELARLASKLYDLNAFDLVIIITEKVKKLCDGELNEIISSMYESSVIKDEYYKNFPQLMKDDRIIGPLKGPIYYYFTEDIEDGDEDKNFNAIESAMENAPKEVIDSLKIMKESYYKLYEVRKELYEEIEKIARKNYKLEEEYIKIKDDRDITHGLKRLVALWLATGISDYERKKYASDILNEINNENIDRINKAARKIKNIYVNIYKLNPEIIDELINISDRSTQSNNTSRNNNYNTNNSSSNNSTSNSSGGGCLACIGFFIAIALITKTGIFGFFIAIFLLGFNL